MTVSRYDEMSDGTRVDRLTIGQPPGIVAQIMTYGATLVSLLAPDRVGTLDEVVLGLGSLDAYRGHQGYIGATVGRFANRIAGASFALDGRTVRLTPNEGSNCLHGGPQGFDRAVWRIVDVDRGDAPCVVLAHRSPDGDQGFPGTLEIEVSFRIVRGHTLAVEYRATTDRPTVLNPTNHSYFDLGGSRCVLDDELTVAADTWMPVDIDLVVTGERAGVAGTPFDLRRTRRIGDALAVPHPQTALTGGFDHNFVLARRTRIAFAAALYAPRTGRRLEVHTTEPGLQVYTGNQLDGTLRGPDGRAHWRHAGVCLETQHFPDSPNRPEFPSTVLRPGDVFRSATEYQFSVR